MSRLINAIALAVALVTAGCYGTTSVKNPGEPSSRGSADRAQLDLKRPLTALNDLSKTPRAE
jgi:hypothetical protein